jgi:uncharacterized protein (TIGR03067 family)
MKRRVLALLLLLPVGVVAQEDAKKELERLRGSWTLISAAGQQLPPGLHSGLIVTGDKYQGLTNGKIDEAGTIKLDVATKPMSIDLVIAEGTHKGKTQLGVVVDITGDTMTLLLAEPGDTVRPDPMSQSTLVLTKTKPLGKDLDGSWEGALDAGGKALRVVVKLSNGSDGLATGTFDSVDQGSGPLPIAAVIQTGSQIKLVVPAVRGSFAGELKDGQLTGTWTQGRTASPLIFKRSM